MPSFKNGDVEIAYLDEGGDSSLPPVVLVHGFASTKETNWVYPGWCGSRKRPVARRVRS
jgi:pimeloyl-ACP methyl ester carboxylesterase